MMSIHQKRLRLKLYDVYYQLMSQVEDMEIKDSILILQGRASCPIVLKYVVYIKN